ncbi:uncharacterized protein N7458_003278 [Penicillium daleae]|uniref:Uncharacterized protein n=1 Tax=Penicillium daleae TaxID=63821 RepID=A0AAD6CF54_9EURO|nr:uncharacterized protein N7458_003278 [Penicillium daleae]KAJ5461726.1 hypothetical protein N7458_003278 [Penicillium daleae]
MSVDNGATEFADEASSHQIPSAGPDLQESSSKRDWAPWIVDPVATDHVCADTPTVLETIRRSGSDDNPC